MSSLRASRCEVLRRQVAELVQKSQFADDKAQALLLDAECAVRNGDKKEAIKLYENIVGQYSWTASAETALFEAATLKSDVGSNEQALASADAYLQRYPQGRFADAMRFRRCEHLVRASRLPDARECLVAYRHDFPDGVKSRAALFLLASLARAEQRFRESAELYAQYLATTSEKAEEALYFRAVCLQKGGLPGADEAAAEYLRRFPEGPHAPDLRGARGVR